MNRWMMFGLGIGGALTLLAALSSKEWGLGGAVAAVAYAILVTIFLLAQIYGFVASQINYADSVEDAKFKLLELEGIVCENPYKKEL